jgi:hypothetical protein
MNKTWQARLQAKMNILSQKLLDNAITLAGVSTDVIFIRQNLNNVSDPVSITVDDIDVINIMFPGLKDIPMRRFLFQDNQQFYVANDGAEDEIQPFECYIETKYRVDQGSIILKFFDNPQGSTPNGTTPSTEKPWVLPLKISEILGTFGGRSMVYQKCLLVYQDHQIPDQILTWALQLAQRRQILGW